MPKKSLNIWGTFGNKICYQEFPKVAQSGHTALSPQFLTSNRKRIQLEGFLTWRQIQVELVPVESVVKVVSDQDLGEEDRTQVVPDQNLDQTVIRATLNRSVRI